MCAFLYVALATGVCALQAQAIQAEPVDSLPVPADWEEPGSIRLPSTALQVSTPGTARLIDAGVSDALLRATGKRLGADADALEAPGKGRTGSTLKPGKIDSSTVKASALDDQGTRILAKLAAGTTSFFAVTAASGLFFIMLASDSFLSGGEVVDPVHALFFLGTLVGSSIGFPIGVTLVDPHDSNSKTIFAGAASGLGALILAGSMASNSNNLLPALSLLYLSPAIVSIITSEKSRRPSEERPVSLSLSPNPHGGLSAVANFRF